MDEIDAMRILPRYATHRSLVEDAHTAAARAKRRRLIANRSSEDDTTRLRMIPILGATTAVIPGTDPERETIRRLSRPPRAAHKHSDKCLCRKCAG